MPSFPTPYTRDLDGILLLDKPVGPSSNQALQRAKCALGAKKAGHAGTLDPLASGLLPILLGEATKFAGLLADSDKEYAATLWLGVTTTTGDRGGEILERRPVQVTIEQVRRVAEQFLGELDQVPPMHSAIKVGGRPLYERARRGETVARAARRVHVMGLVVGELREDKCDITVRCSKGTYIRVLAEDMGQALGCGATIEALRRTMVGPFSLAAATSLAELQERGAEWGTGRLLPVDAAIQHLPPIRLDPSMVARVLQGQAVSVQAEPDVAIARLYDADHRFIGLGSVIAGTLHPRRLVASPPAA